MEFETKILSKGIQEMLYNSDKTVGTAESCTGGRIAEALISVPGASNYFKGGVVSYTNEVKENLLGVSHEVLEEQTAVCEEVAREMVLGTIKTLNVDFAISATGVAGAARHPRRAEYCRQIGRKRRLGGCHIFLLNRQPLPEGPARYGYR